MRFDKLSLYVKHLPRKMTEQEIQNSIFDALIKSQNNTQFMYEYIFMLRLFDPTKQAIEELLYIYDTHPLKQMNIKR